MRRCKMKPTRNSCAINLLVYRKIKAATRLILQVSQQISYSKAKNCFRLASNDHAAYLFITGRQMVVISDIRLQTAVFNITK